MQRPYQKVVLQEPFGGEHVNTVYRTVRNIQLAKVGIAPAPGPIRPWAMNTQGGHYPLQE